MFLNAILKIPFLFILFDSLAFRSENETVNYAFLTPRYFGNAIHCWGRRVVWARAACTHTPTGGGCFQLGDEFRATRRKRLMFRSDGGERGGAKRRPPVNASFALSIKSRVRLSAAVLAI